MESIEFLIGSFNEFKNAQLKHNQITNEKLDDIIVQTTKTNGRVTSLEGLKPKVEELMTQKSFSGGKNSVWLKLAAGLGPILAAIITYYLKK